MSLLTSFRTQDDQVALRMRELKVQVQRDFHAMPKAGTSSSWSKAITMLPLLLILDS